MASPPDRLVVRTHDFDEAVDAMRSAFGDVELRRTGDEPCSLSLRVVATQQLAVTRWSVAGIGGGSRTETDSAGPPMFLTGIRIDGTAASWSREGAMDVDRPFLYPEAIDSSFDQPQIANLAIAQESVLARAQLLTGGLCPEFRFTGTAPMNAALDALWRDTMIHAARTLEALAGQTDIALADTGLLDHLALVLLHTFPNTALETADRQRAGRAQTASLRRALQYIDDHLDASFATPDLAAAARLSLRGLHAMFRRELDTTPMAYVRSARLAAARAELQRADPATTEVAAIALRWGFAQEDRFSRRYRAAFGESPAQTLAT